MLNPARPGDIRDVNQTVNTVFDFDEGPKISEIADPAVDARANLIPLVQRAPRVVLNLFHTEADATCFRIDRQDFHFDRISRVDDLARMLDAFRPAHL